MSKNLPEQIRKQSEEIQALYSEMEKNEGADPENSSTEPAPNGEGDPAPTTATAEQPGDASPSSRNEQAGEERSNKDNQGEDWEHKYKTLQGMHKVEMQKLRDSEADLKTRLESMEKLIAGMNAEHSRPSASEVEVGSVVTEDDITNYGESIDVMRRVSKEEMAPVLSQLQSLNQIVSNLTTEVMPKVDSIATTQARSAGQQFFAAIEAAVPNWREINGNDDFTTWLYLPDPISGVYRQDLLERAQKEGDAQRAIAIFRAWIAETGYGSSNSETTNARDTVNTELNAQIAPGTTRTGGQPQEEQPGKQWTRAEVRAFYDDVTRGVYKGREGERKQIENDIFKAQNEGRVV